jgi:predicted acetyltransferase/RimJ/RimL family protein N-acetyltransferase
MTGNITFKLADKNDEPIIFSWLAEPHMIEFWDNSEEHKDDILNFIHGRKQHYFAGTTKYFIALADNVPFAFILGDVMQADENLSAFQKEAMSKFGNTISVDFGIGNPDYIGKGLASQTLEKFILYYQENIDPKSDTFFIDPDENNPKAKHVYEKSGFKHIGEYKPTEGAFVGHTNLSMIKKIPPRIDVIKADVSDRELLENLTHLFIYELSPYYPFEMQSNGTWNKKGNIEKYLVEKDRSAWLLKIGTDVIGFALINSKMHDSDSQYNLAEFFILSRFQKSGAGTKAVHMLWDMHPGVWEIMTLANYNVGIKFWDKVIKSYLFNDNYKKEIVNVDFDKVIPKRQLYTFDTNNKSSLHLNIKEK